MFANETKNTLACKLNKEQTLSFRMHLQVVINFKHLMYSELQCSHPRSVTADVALDQMFGVYKI